MMFARNIAARTIWQEARGEPVEGQRAVAHVIINRMKDKRWGKTLVSACLWPMQFSGWNSSDPNRVKSMELPEDHPTLIAFEKMIEDAMVEPDLTGGATHYHSAKMDLPNWAEGQPSIRIGNHLFYKGIK